MELLLQTFKLLCRREQFYSQCSRTPISNQQQVLFLLSDYTWRTAADVELLSVIVSVPPGYHGKASEWGLNVKLDEMKNLGTERVSTSHWGAYIQTHRGHSGVGLIYLRHNITHHLGGSICQCWFSASAWPWAATSIFLCESCLNRRVVQGCSWRSKVAGLLIGSGLRKLLQLGCSVKRLRREAGACASLYAIYTQPVLRRKKGVGCHGL